MSSKETPKLLFEIRFHFLCHMDEGYPIIHFTKKFIFMVIKFPYT